LGDSLDDLLRALEGQGLEGLVELPGEDGACLDLNRATRKGVPEVVMAQAKTPETTARIARCFVEAHGRALVSRVTDRHLERLRKEFPDMDIQFCEASRMAVVSRPGYKTPKTGGRVGVVTAGTSDVPVAEEAKIIAEEMGCDVTVAYDVGVAGIHRLLAHVEALRKANCVVAVAGKVNVPPEPLIFKL